MFGGEASPPVDWTLHVRSVTVNVQAFFLEGVDL